MFFAVHPKIVLNTTFQISSPIISPSLRVLPEQSEYIYPYVGEFVISIESAANARCQIYTGEEFDPKKPTFDIQTVGKWESDLVVPYTFRYPGMHAMHVNCSNSINFELTETLYYNLETRVDSLRAGLFQDPVIYLMSGFGEAMFKFYYEDIMTSGTDARVTFWPGDSSNDTYGPFDIGMNFMGNYNENPLSYRYTEVSNFTAVFLIENRFGAIMSSMTFEVIPGLDGFFIDCIPKRMLRNNPVEVSAFVIQGRNVNFTWYFEGRFMHNQMRICKK